MLEIHLVNKVFVGVEQAGARQVFVLTRAFLLRFEREAAGVVTGRT